MRTRICILTGLIALTGCSQSHTQSTSLSGMSPQHAFGNALASLSNIFGIRPARIKDCAEKYYFHDWLRDPFARGAYSYVRVGGTRAMARLAEPIQRTLFFAGEATDTSGKASTV